MKVIVLICCAITAVACSPTAINEWEQYKSSFGKSYENSHEESYRKSVFNKNLNLVNTHNERFSKGLETYDLEMNKFGDMTADEVTMLMTGLSEKKVVSTKIFSYDPEEEVSANVDWRDKGAVTGVKNQEQCGSCWAFSATGSLEGQHFLKTGKLVSLSEQNLVDCSKDFGNMGCLGGLPEYAFKYIKQNGGIDTEESYPYEQKDGKCRFDKANVGATLTGYVDLPHDDEKALLNAVDKIGPISVGIDASAMSFHLYKSGVYYNKDCSSVKLDHGVLAAGYGEDNGDAYWLVKNSWGGDWGEKGYIKMARDKDNNCGIATAACYPLL